MRKNFVRLLVLTATLGAMAAPVAAVAAPTPITISSPSCPSVLKQGEKDGCVTDLQTRLNRYYALLGVDGDFGSDTLAAVKTYQSAQGLSVDGEVGPATKQSLLRTMATPPPGLATGGGASTIVQHATAIKNGAAEHGLARRPNHVRGGRRPRRFGQAVRRHLRRLHRFYQPLPGRGHHRAGLFRFQSVGVRPGLRLGRARRWHRE
ncbi:peptidoglycan-binding domain-containing protein [Fodinicola feengrottensis]|uniref:peptidoglycan-binding domain-containing protein n=1 Tax=Fodinicola feengrottensis TaxID=435914 RepID=UPI002442845A|nr:peptidoglycan-binding domain-containing protein [Fodinicola feengrottensis]